MLNDTQKHAYRAWRRMVPFTRAVPAVALDRARAGVFPKTRARVSGGRGTQDGKPVLYWDGIESIPFRNVRYADDVVRSIRHNGWYCDSFQDRTLRGIVAQLPTRQGQLTYLYGHESSDGECILYLDVMSDESDAARCADDCAKRSAEQEREYQDAWQAGQEHGAKVQEALDALRDEVRRLMVAGLYARDMGLPAAEDWDDSYILARDDLRDALQDAERAEPSRGSLRDSFRDGFAGECGKIAKLGGKHV